MFGPTLFMDIYTTFGAFIDVNSGILAADGALHGKILLL